MEEKALGTVYRYGSCILIVLGYRCGTCLTSGQKAGIILHLHQNALENLVIFLHDEFLGFLDYISIANS